MLNPAAGSVFESLTLRMVSPASWSFRDEPKDNFRWSVEMKFALRNHWPEYLIEAAGLCLFMISACLFTAFLFYPTSPAHTAISSPMLRRILMGALMGLTAIAIIYSPFGKRSGAHLNPSVTLTFFRLGKVGQWDAILYILAQFVGGLAGVLLASLILGQLIADPSVNYAATTPGEWGPAVAFVAEVLISFILMFVVLTTSNTRRVEHLTGVFAGMLVAAYISIESPISGMSMNPARTFGSALPAGVWTALWVYFTAPPIGMLLAAELHTRIRGDRTVACAKLHHRNNQRCIFRCSYNQQSA
jgi:aquaporin Z